MVIELVAGRLIARHLGNSLYVWSSIIGVVLAGMSVGNVIGGKLADRYKPETILGWLFMTSSVACVLTLKINDFFAATTPLRALPWGLQTFLSALIIFALPAVVLGTISPSLAKVALSRGTKVGTTLGSFYAWAAAGSILGTFLTGFWLIALLGSKGVVLFTASGLGLVAVFLGPTRLVYVGWVAIVCLMLASTRNAPVPPSKAVPVIAPVAKVSSGVTVVGRGSEQ